MKTPKEYIKENTKSVQESVSFSSSFSKLEAVAASLSSTLDTSSEQIKTIENRLRELKTNFPCKMCIREETPSLEKKLDARRNSLTNLNLGTSYYTQVFWFLSWETDEASKSYRLFLISEKDEVTLPVWSVEPIILTCDVLFKKPLIETKLEIRLEFSKYTVPFITFFTEQLEAYKLSIEKKLPFAAEKIHKSHSEAKKSVEKTKNELVPKSEDLLVAKTKGEEATFIDDLPF